jgi:hemerythrin-like metal-binding protein
VEWDPTLETGDALVDAQHKGLFELLNELHTAVVEQRGNEIAEEVIYRLLRYTATHFADEEALMERFGYPGVFEHHQLHQALTRETASLAERYLDGHDVLPLTISMFLHDWLMKHIREQDQRVIAYVNEHRAHVEPLGKHEDDPWVGRVEPWKEP